MDANTQSVKKDEFAKLTLMDRIAYGLGNFAQNLVFGTVGGFLLFFLTTVNGISAAAGATIFLVVRWINVVWDPWVGATVDKSQPKGGKYLPYLRNFGIPLVILAACFFLPVGLQWFPALSKVPYYSAIWQQPWFARSLTFIRDLCLCDIFVMLNLVTTVLGVG